MKDKQNGTSTTDEEIPLEKIQQYCDEFFANPWNAFVMDMFAVHDGDMTLREALDRRKIQKVKTNG